MVRGADMAVTKVPATYQWADIESTALGFGIAAPQALQALVKSLPPRAFIGLPWPKKMAGMGFSIATVPL
jgi:hypothetical protein